ncbi:cysteine protease [Trifolium pratense]|uniref:Cysteine protease n=1 Tax=Trifolium pratense TaxID=57577 RepID=A0A2K3PS51_TRIPR|nr:cysteine protease [Trifolium pratense]
MVVFLRPVSLQHNYTMVEFLVKMIIRIRQMNCRNDFIPVAGFRDFQVIPPNDEQQLLQVVVQQPVTVNIAGAAGTDELYNFKGGEIYSGACGNETDHSVVIVGYGVSNEGTKYWLIKNSLDELWGNQATLD